MLYQSMCFSEYLIWIYICSICFLDVRPWIDSVLAAAMCSFARSLRLCGFMKTHWCSWSLHVLRCDGGRCQDCKWLKIRLSFGCLSNCYLNLFALNDFMLTTLQVELAAISSSKGQSLDPAAFGWALSKTCNGIWAPRCCFTACACRHDARCHSLPAEWYRFAWCVSLSFASASAVFNCHMNKLQQVPEQFCNACLQPYGHDPADCKNKEGRWCTIVCVRSTIPHHKRFSVNCHKMFCLLQALLMFTDEAFPVWA